MNNRILELRRYFGLSQAQFGRQIGKSAAYVCKMEKGEVQPSAEAQEAICKAFHINSLWLIGESENMFVFGLEKRPYDMSQIGTRIKEIRKEKALTQAEFAAALHCSKEQVYSIEAGRVRPSQKWLQKLISTFSLREEYLLSGEGNKWDDEKSVQDEQLLSYLEKHRKAREVLHEIILHESPVIWDQIDCIVRQSREDEDSSHRDGSR